MKVIVLTSCLCWEHDRQVDQQTGRLKDKCIDRWTDGKTDLNERRERGTDGRTDRPTEGRTDGRTIRQMDKQTDRQSESVSQSITNQNSLLSFACLSLQKRGRGRLQILPFWIWSSHIWNRYPSYHLQRTQMIVSAIYPRGIPWITQQGCAVNPRNPYPPHTKK